MLSSDPKFSTLCHISAEREQCIKRWSMVLSSLHLLTGHSLVVTKHLRLTTLIPPYLHKCGTFFLLTHVSDRPARSVLAWLCVAALRIPNTQRWQGPMFWKPCSIQLTPYSSRKNTKPLLLCLKDSEMALCEWFLFLGRVCFNILVILLGYIYILHTGSLALFNSFISCFSNPRWTVVSVDNKKHFFPVVTCTVCANSVNW